MKRHVEVVIEYGSLSREIWRFYYLGPRGAVLDGWRMERRKTKRHKFRTATSDDVWSRLRHPQDVQRSDFPKPPEHVIAEALELFRASVRYDYTEGAQ